jgi:DNA-binding protein WhiA
VSFSYDAKKELCRQTPSDVPCLRAQACGLLLFGRSFGRDGMSLVTEHREVADLYCKLVSQLGMMADKLTSLSRRKKNSALYTAVVPDQGDRERLLDLFACVDGDGSLCLPSNLLKGPNVLSAFLRGAFLSCGTVTDPNKDYHLELSCPTKRLAEDLSGLLRRENALSLEAGMVERKGSYVVYLKGSEHIADLLTYLGAQQAAMELIQVKMLKEVRNYVNRTTNFTTANIGKTASAAAQQLSAIQKIESKWGLDGLPEELRELARLRKENPEMSLRELGESLTEPISRSGVNHRLKRIMEIAGGI